jgi:hypothetical protein
MIQGVTSLAFGPMLGIVCTYLGTDRFDMSPLLCFDMFDMSSLPWFSKHIVPMARSIHQANMIITFSVLVATIVRLRQGSPLAEESFLRNLCEYELLIAVICTVSYLPIRGASRTRTGVMISYATITLIMTMTMVWTSSGPEFHRVLEDIAASCVGEHNWPGSISPTTPKDESSSNIFWTSVKVLIALFAMMSLGLCYCCPWYILLANLGRGGVHFEFLVIVVVLAWFSAMTVWYCLVSMMAQRQTIQLASGPMYQDNDWGFGQVAALLTWIPTAQDILLASLGMSCPDVALASANHSVPATCRYLIGGRGAGWDSHDDPELHELLEVSPGLPSQDADESPVAGSSIGHQAPVSTSQATDSIRGSIDNSAGGSRLTRPRNDSQNDAPIFHFTAQSGSGNDSRADTPTFNFTMQSSPGNDSRENLPTIPFIPQGSSRNDSLADLPT